ncbi:zinc finger protein 107-like [Centropristis striata]|uniref:zinc finger protein 107-like n=1 Tax=Centropristis striata TaxID=184440 RepID=UPI0027E0FE7A|nr:zinc finger protein 107-like [Centropristis striata]
MLDCCVSGCENRRSSISKLKFYKLPCGSGPFQANRRRLWIQAIQQANGSTEELKGSARICGAHFKSKEASMDHDHPDFVPSVFTCAQQRPKKTVKRIYGHRKRLQRTAKTEETPKTEETEETPRGFSPVDFDSSFSTEEGEALTEEAEFESENTSGKSQTASSPKTASPSFKIPAGILGLDKRKPIVLLKDICISAGGYQCDQCDQSFTDVPQLMKHKHLHEEESSTICIICEKFFMSQADLTQHHCVCEPSFQCNICDRSFTSNHNLKRHKLLHVKDGRKCGTCGVLFCQRHNHILYLPSAETVTEYEEDSSIIPPQNLDSNLQPENHLLEKPEPSETADPEDNAQSTMIVSPVHPKPEPLFETDKDLSPVSHSGMSSEIAEPLFLKPSSVSLLPPPVPRVSKNTSSQFRPTYPVRPIPPPNLELPPSLKLFSPQFLTSAFLEVKRNYEYILSKPGGVKKKKNVVKEEQCELPLNSPVEHVKTERTAYDLEIVL